MMAKEEQSVKSIIDILVKGKLFDRDLGKNNFNIFTEILSNASRKKLKKCFSRRSRKGLKKHRNTVRKLLSRKISLKKRMKTLRKTNESFRRVVRAVINDFMTRCCEFDTENAQ